MLATDLRPSTLDDFLGQSHLVSKGGPIKEMMESNNLPSMIFWGPPATGKTTLARIISNSTESEFIELSAVLDGKTKLVKVLDRAKELQNVNTKTILFIDEIHRWNKAQQDALLPHVESGLITLIGATTENPSFTIINALLSRATVFLFNPLTIADIVEGLKRGFDHINKDKKEISDEDMELIAANSNGDIRFALNALELAYNLAGKTINKKAIESSVQKKLRYDKNGEEHYNLISAMHKSLRSSDATAATYWIVRMLEGGEGPLYVARRLLRFASEDIGNASPTALMLANQVYDACHKLGMPECGVHLVQLGEYLAKSPKNNSSYNAYKEAMIDIKKYGNLDVPIHLKNAPTKLMKDLGYGQGYEYDHNLTNKKSDQQLMPDELINRNYFT